MPTPRPRIQAGENFPKGDDAAKAGPPYGNMTESTRLDKWLWFARFFKTRSLATKACAAGHVKRDGLALKPAASVQAGDVLEIPFQEGPGARRITVTGMLEKRVGAVLAAAVYEDHTPEAVLEARRLALAEKAVRREGDQGRPTKRDRRAMSRIRGFFE